MYARSSTSVIQSGNADRPKPGCDGASRRACWESFAAYRPAGSKPSHPCRNSIGAPAPDSNISSVAPAMAIVELRTPPPVPTDNRVRPRSTPEPPARDGRTVAHRLELGPDHVLGHLGVADDGAEAAIGSGHDALAVADGAHGALQPLGDHLGVLDIVVRRLDHAADQDHAIGQLLD